LLGLTGEGEWALSFSRDGRPEIHSLAEPAVVAALPVLEVPYREVLRQLDRRAGRLGLAPGALTGGFPARRVIERALETTSDHWIGLAASWLEQGAAAPFALAPVIARVVADRRVAQRLRHRLRRLVGSREDDR
jgi:hypothetical protein